MADPELLARLDRIALLLVALLGVELWKSLDIDILAVGLLVVAGLVFGFAFLWGQSVLELLFGENV